jgi:integrase
MGLLGAPTLLHWPIASETAKPRLPAREFAPLHFEPSERDRLFTEEIPDVPILTFEEEFKYLALASEPLKSVAIIMLGEGMRPGELFRMTYQNMDFANRTILIVRGKTRNAKRTLSMCPGSV